MTRRYPLTLLVAGLLLLPSIVRAVPDTVGASSVDAPVNLVATAMSPSRIDLSWAYASTDPVDGFQVFRSVSSMGPWFQIGATGPDLKTFSAEGLGVSTTYFFIVRSFDTAGTSGFSNMVSATTPGRAGGPPSAPVNPGAQAVSSSAITLSWIDTSSDEAGFQIFRSLNASGPWYQIAVVDADTTGFADSGLSSATIYFYSLRAYGAGGNSAFTPIVSATTSSISSIPAAPSDLQAVAVSPSQINLSWTDSSSDELGFKIERASSFSGPWSAISIVGSGAVGYADTSVVYSTSYYYRVRAYSAAGDSAPSNTSSATTPSTQNPIPDGAPSNLSAIAVSPNKINLTWTDNSTNESGFAIERYGIQGWAVLASVSGTSYSDDGLVPVTTYYYRVRAVNGAGSSDYSSLAVGTTLAAVQPPDAPSGLTARGVSSSQIDLEWTDNSTNETRFKVERAPAASGPFVQIASITGTSYSDTGLAAATTYFYRVRASNLVAYSEYTSVVSAATLQGQTAPDAPTGLTAVASSSTQIVLSWTDASDNESGFVIERARSSSGPFSQVVVTGPNATTFTDTGSPATTYYYRLAAYNAVGSSGYSNMASVTTRASIPFAPTDLTAAASGSQILLTWSDASDSEVGFRIERASSPAGPFTQLALAAANATSYTDTGSPATTYFYRVAAYNAAGTSAYSNVASATTRSSVPGAPTTLVATGASTTQINLTWTATSTNEDGFRIERASSAAGPFTQVGIASADSAAYIDTVSPSTTYYYRVAAYNSAGTSAYSNTASATTKAAVPAAPTGLAAIAASTTQINLTWVDGSTNETSFKIERASSAGGTYSLIASRAAASTSYSDTGLTPSTAYFYRVRASNAAGDSVYSNTATATTQGATDTEDPSVPHDVNVVAPGCGQITVSWSASTDTGGSGLKGYDIYRKNVLIKHVAAPATSTLDLNLPPATYYYYNVVAVDNAGNQSAKSSIAGAPTQACAGDGGDHIWSRSIGGAQVPDNGMAVAVDKSGNVFVTGEFQGSADFGGGSISSTGYRDVYVAKYAPDGTELWSKPFGGIYDDTGRAIAVDSRGDVFLTGLFPRTLDFGGPDLVSAGGYDIFLVKLSGTDGHHLWSKRIGGSGDDRADGIAVNSRGDVAITGQFKGTVDFGDGPVTNTSPFAQAYMAKYSGTDGAHLWSKRFGAPSGSDQSTFGSGQGVAFDANDNAVLTGYFRGNPDFGGGPLDNAGGLDVFVAKFSSSGSPLWSEAFGGTSDDHALGLALDAAGNISIAGDFLDAIDFGYGPLDSTTNAQTIFLASLTSDGRPRWARSFVAGGLNIGSFVFAIATDPSGNIILTGSLSGPVDFGGGPLPVVGTVFLAKLTSAGNHLWSKTFSGQGGRGHGLDVDASGNILITGSYEIDIDLGGGDYRAEGASSSDIFLVKVGP